MGGWVLGVNGMAGGDNNNNNNMILNDIQKWIIVGYLILTGLILAFIISLLGFHLYITCCGGMTTKEYIYQGK